MHCGSQNTVAGRIMFLARVSVKAMSKNSMTAELLTTTMIVATSLKNKFRK
jgi:hypothetical protein